MTDKKKKEIIPVRDFLDGLVTQGMDAAYVVRLKDEFTELTFGEAARAYEVPYERWPILWDLFDERLGIMAEGREPTEEEISLAWNEAIKEADSFECSV